MGNRSSILFLESRGFFVFDFDFFFGDIFHWTNCRVGRAFGHKVPFLRPDEEVSSA